MSSTTREAGLLDHKTNSADVLLVGDSFALLIINRRSGGEE